MKIGRTERALLSIGLMLLAVWGSIRFYGAIRSHAAVAQFAAARQRGLNHGHRLPEALSNSRVDFRLWSMQRISAYKDSLNKTFDPPIAVLSIPKLDLVVPVFDDTNDLTLDRGVGRIHGTTQVGQPGNLGIAGHRDGFFRGLQDIAAGDIIELARPRATDTYVVRKLEVVTPEDTYVLEPTPTPTMTLVTCFPFYFVGHAPKRFIVTASLESTSPLDSDTGEGINSAQQIKTDKENRR